MTGSATRIALIATPAFILGLLAGGGAVYLQQSATEEHENWVLTFMVGDSGCPAPADTTIAVKRVTAIVQASAPRGASAKGWVEHGHALYADLFIPDGGGLTLQGTLGAPAETNSWSFAGRTSARHCHGTWTSTRKTSFLSQRLIAS